ncbi:hypothetical protein [Sulfobacillus thermosulfidooxidans]|uniref:hypothetical protein n=1 Tax=Sulfobacillus thermosulfidooxidans TaxID=28034 RepID=UPI0006B50364|nr:hypothetical protein [Sulfobacillus thermosulfidooxidans]
MQRVQAAQDWAVTFVFITNLPASSFDARRLLEEPTGQTVIEQRFLLSPLMTRTKRIHNGRWPWFRWRWRTGRDRLE